MKIYIYLFIFLSTYLLLSLFTIHRKNIYVRNASEDPIRSDDSSQVDDPVQSDNSIHFDESEALARCVADSLK